MDYTRLIIKGKVHGVGYRYFVFKKAIEKKARGYVRNLTDGSVEVLIDAISAKDERFMTSIEKGPVLSRVDEILRDELPIGGNIFDFNIK